MIDFIIAFFYFTDDLGLLKIEQIFTTNLITLLLIRGFYIAIYLLTYHKKYERTESFILSKKEIIYFGVKQVSLILFGILFFPLTVFISVYSLMISGIYIKQWHFKSKKRIFKILGFLITLLTPLLSILWFTFINIDFYSITAIGISLVVFLQYGLKTGKHSLKELVDKYARRRIQKLPQIFHYILLFILIAFPSSFLIMTVAYSPPKVITYMVPMRDDVRLATDVYFAPGSFGTPRPVILVRTPYGKSGMGELYGLLYSTQNYHLVVQDIRGTFDSPAGNKYLLFADAYKDGVDTIEWILKQPWCNGKIASTGASALGINEYYYAGMNPSGLVAQSLMIATPDLYKTSIYQGGEFKESIATQWVMMTSPDNYEYQLEQLIAHPKKDIFYNSTSLFMDIGPTFKNVSVAGIHIGGWYDPFQQGTLDGYMCYDDSGLPSAKGKQFLIMGPFTHGFPGEGKRGELVFPTKSVSGYELYLDWEQKVFNYALLGSPIDWDGNRVAYYLMGDINDASANDYRYAKDWPIPYTNDTWYLTANNGLNISGSGIQSNNLTYQFDPRDPVPTLGGTNLVIASGPYDQSSLESRDDVLIFDSPVFSSPYEVIGNMWAHLYVKSNCTNTDFTVKISDVYPDGRSILISDGIINAMRRNGFNNTAIALNSESIEFAEVDIDLWSTAYRFDTGHKIRIAISSSNYPRFGVNPNTGETPRAYSYQYLQRFIANNSILVGPDYPSYITLPTPI